MVECGYKGQVKDSRGEIVDSWLDERVEAGSKNIKTKINKVDTTRSSVVFVCALVIMGRMNPTSTTSESDN